jgi:hypothetical protein
MRYTCPLCALNPRSHSLIEVAEKNNTLYYYTCPSKAELYFDLKSIISHYDGVFSEIPENKQWVWIFDGTDFNLKHFLQLQVGIELSKLISLKFNKNLKAIIVINPTFYISSIYKIINIFLDEKIKSIIEINYQHKTVDEIII